jgi:hypothetical protein
MILPALDRAKLARRAIRSCRRGPPIQTRRLAARALQAFRRGLTPLSSCSHRQDDPRHLAALERRHNDGYLREDRQRRFNPSYAVARDCLIVHQLCTNSDACDSSRGKLGVADQRLNPAVGA